MKRKSLNLSESYKRTKDHSTIMLTTFYPILTTSPPQVDNCGHFTYCLPFVHMTKCEFSIDLYTSSCQSSYWMTTYCIIFTEHVKIVQIGWNYVESGTKLILKKCMNPLHEFLFRHPCFGSHENLNCEPKYYPGIDFI